MASSLGTAAGTDIPIEHLSYEYIGKCTNAEEVEKILRVLRSNKEGHYPDLITCTEKRLQQLNPKSKLLIKDNKAKSLSDLPRNEYREIASELDNWEQRISMEDSQLKARNPEGRAQGGVVREEEEEEEGTLPPVRDAAVISDAKKSDMPKKKDPSQIKSHDYRAWDKYNAEEEASKVDTESKDKAQASTKTKVSAQLSDKELSMSAADKERLSVNEKEKGNEAYRAGDHHEALAYYTRSIALHPSVAAYNNRALTALKLENYQGTIADCTEVLKLDPQNTKALFRRATAHSGKKGYQKAADDLKRLLQLEPNNKKAQEQLSKLQKEFLEVRREGTEAEVAIGGEEEEEKPRRKGRRIQIKEVGSEDESEGTLPLKQDKSQPATRTDTPAGPDIANSASHSRTASTPNTSSSSAAGIVPPSPVQRPPSPPPLPPRVKELKEKGNSRFRSGQYSDALLNYSKAIQLLEAEGKAHTHSLSTLLNNRAACHLKIGDCRGSVQDCTHSLSLVPINIKALMRRGAAYEAMEKYKLAYNDFHMALRIDSTVEVAFTACSRISVLLRDRDGNDWRSKLPTHPESQDILAALSNNFSLPTVVDSGDGSDGRVTEDESGRREERERSEGEKGESGGVERESGAAMEQEVEESHDGGEEGGRDGEVEGGRYGGEESELIGDDAQQNEGATDETVESEGSDGDREGEEGSSGVEEGENGGEGKQPSSVPMVTSTAATPGHYSTKVTQSTEPVTSTTMSNSRSSPSPPSNGSGGEKEESIEEKFERYKLKGKGHVERGEFMDALNSYSICVQTCPNKAVAYTNRAHCYLKLMSPRKAEEDTSKALELEPQNVKALYRRGLARKELKRYADAAKDLKMLLDIDQTISVAKKELEVVKQLWEKQLRDIQSKQPASKTSQKTAQKTTQKMKSLGGKPKENKKSPQARDKKTTKEGAKNGAKRPPRMQQSATRKGSNPSSAPLYVRTSASTAATTEGENLMSAAKTTYFKDKGVEKGDSDSGLRRRIQVVVREESSGSSEEGEEEKKEMNEVEESVPSELLKEPSEPVKVPSEPATVPSEPVTVPSEPVTVPSEPVTVPSEPVTVPSEPVTVPSEPATVPSEPVKVPSEPATVPSEPATVPSEPVRVPSEPVKVPAADLVKEPSTTKPEQEATKSLPRVTRDTVRNKLSSGYEFVQKWNAIPRTAPSMEYANLLEQIAPDTLPEVITNKLDGIMLTNIIRAVDKQFIPRGLYKLSVEILQNLAKVPRFGMIAMFLSPMEKQDLGKVFRALSTQTELEISPPTLDHLRESYGVDK